VVVTGVRRWHAPAPARAGSQPAKRPRVDGGLAGSGASGVVAVALGPAARYCSSARRASAAGARRRLPRACALAASTDGALARPALHGGQTRARATPLPPPPVRAAAPRRPPGAACPARAQQRSRSAPRRSRLRETHRANTRGTPRVAGPRSAPRSVLEGIEPCTWRGRPRPRGENYRSPAARARLGFAVPSPVLPTAGARAERTYVWGV